MTQNNGLKIGITVAARGGIYFVRTPGKDQLFIDTLKRLISPHLRGWDGPTMSWTISPQALPTLQEVIRRAGYQMPAIPSISYTAPAPVQKTIRLEYIGQCKEREDKSITALGQVDGFWSIEIPEDVLKAHFEKRGGKPLVTDAQTHYQILCVFENATAEQIKSAFRQLSRHWHPDVCQEPEGPEKFMAIRAAYDVLKDPQARKRYDFGLHFEREAARRLAEQNEAPAPAPRGRRPKFLDSPHYRAPLRCGLLTVEGVQAVGKFKVTKILSWVDATDEQGRTMTATWDKTARAVKIRWI